jgi:hypothetical protein
MIPLYLAALPPDIATSNSFAGLPPATQQNISAWIYVNKAINIKHKPTSSSKTMQRLP